MVNTNRVVMVNHGSIFFVYVAVTTCKSNVFSCKLLR